MAKLDFNISCSACMRDLAGADSHGACPHCGQPMPTILHDWGIDASDLKIDHDLACNTCGYNLRTQPAAGRCPECGRPALETLSIHPFLVANATWLQNTYAGARLLLASLLGLTGTVIIGVLAGVGFVSYRGFVELIVVALVGVGLLLSSVLAWIGLLLAVAERPPPQAIPESKWVTHMGRVCTFLMPFVLTLLFAFVFGARSEAAAALVLLIPPLLVGALLPVLRRVRVLLRRRAKFAWAGFASTLEVTVTASGVLIPLLVVFSSVTSPTVLMENVFTASVIVVSAFNCLGLVAVLYVFVRTMKHTLGRPRRAASV